MDPGQLIQARIGHKLGHLRAAIAVRLLLEGVAWTILALIALVFVTLAFDYFFRLERPLRGLIMALAGLGVLAVVWRELIAPLRVPMDAPDLALLVEQRFGQLGDRLIGAIEFGRSADYAAAGTSRAMVERMAGEANELAAPLRFNDVVERRTLLRTWSVAGCAVALLVGFGLWQSDLLGRWFLRNVLFAEIPWPQNTYLAVRGGPDFTVLRGDDLTVVVEAEPRSRVIPHGVTIHARYDSVGKTEETVEADPQDPKRFVKVFRAVAEEFEFHVTGGDDRREPRYGHKVRLIDPPALRDVQFSVRYPNYMNRARPELFGGSRGVLPVPVGAEVTVKARSNKDLRSASIVLAGRVVSEMSPETVRRNGQVVVLPRRFVGAFAVEGENKPASKVLQFALVDTDKHTNRRGAKYMVQIQPDLPPTVDLKKIHIGARISPQAILPLQIKARDDCGIASAAVFLRRGPKAKDDHTQPVQLPPDVAREIDTHHDLDILPLKLKPGLTVYVAARVADTLPAEPAELGGPNVGSSTMLSFTIVKPEDLLTEYVNRQKAISVEFFQAVGLQSDARTNAAAAAQLAAEGTVTPEVRRLLAASAALEVNVAAEVAKAADSLGNIVEEMKNNRIGTETGREQIYTGVVQPLKALAEPLRKVVGSINATKSVTDAAELNQQAAAIEEIQRDVLQQMDEIYERMTKLASKQELANALGLIIKWSQGLLQIIRTKQEQEVGKVLKPTTKPAKEGG